MFKHLTIIDLSSVLAGPSVATFFAELGAKVIKVEHPLHGDVTRSWKLKSEPEDAPLGAYYASVNYKKEICRLNLAEPNDRSVLLEMLRTADILISNFKRGDAEKFGLERPALLAINPQLIEGRITGYSSQPDRVAYDVVLQAETGFMFMNGTPTSGPVKMPVAIMDVIAAHQLKEGLLCALYERERSGRASVVECSLEKSGLSALVNQASNYLMAGHVAQPMGSLHPNIAPYGEMFLCSDQQWIVLAVGNDRQFQAMVRILGVPELAENSLFRHNTDRLENREELYQTLNAFFQKRDAPYWLKTFTENQVPSGLIASMDQVFLNQSAQEMVREEEIEGVLTKRLSSIAFTLQT
jgi:crotonobetainyl-CoA:carnitine CoA-transferase CaiB-like acyl-CoA transferase